MWRAWTIPRIFLLKTSYHLPNGNLQVFQAPHDPCYASSAPHLPFSNIEPSDQITRPVERACEATRASGPDRTFIRLGNWLLVACIVAGEVLASCRVKVGSRHYSCTSCSGILPARMPGKNASWFHEHFNPVNFHPTSSIYSLNDASGNSCLFLYFRCLRREALWLDTRRRREEYGRKSRPGVVWKWYEPHLFVHDRPS